MDQIQMDKDIKLNLKNDGNPNPNGWRFLQWLIERHPRVCLAFAFSLLAAFLLNLYQNQTHTFHVLINLVDKNIPFDWTYSCLYTIIKTCPSREKEEEPSASSSGSPAADSNPNPPACSPLDQFERIPLLDMNIGNLYFSFTNPSLFMLLTPLVLCILSFFGQQPSTTQYSSSLLLLERLSFCLEGIILSQSIMPQLDKFTYFTQFFWLCSFLFTFYIPMCYDRDGVLRISIILKLRNQQESNRGNKIRSNDPNSLEDILRKGFSTGGSYMYSSLFEVSQWSNAVDLKGKRRKITYISCVGEISGSRGMERNIFYWISKSSYGASSSNTGWRITITCRNDIKLIQVPDGQGRVKK